MSGKLVLFIAALPGGSTHTCFNNIWNKDDFIMARRYNPNIMESFNHHGSIGYYYSFGNKAAYEIVDKSSVGVYSNWKKKNPIKQQNINDKAVIMEKFGVNEIHMAIDLLSKVVLNIKYMI